MRTINFVSGAVVALALAFCGSVLFAALAPVFGSVAVLRSIVSLLTLAYLCYLLTQSAVRIGRLTAFALALAVTAVCLFLQPSLLLYSLVHIGLIWLVRCCYFHNTLLGALADLGFCALGFASAVWAAERSASLFLALWCFFLAQALVLPVLRYRSDGGGRAPPDERETFRRAYRSAESALRRMNRI